MIATTLRIQPFHIVLEVRCCEVTLVLRWNCLVDVGVPKSNIKYLPSCATLNIKSHLKIIMPDPQLKNFGNTYPVSFKFL